MKETTLVQFPEIKLVGITARTNNASEMNISTAKIGATFHKFMAENLQAKIKNRKYPGKIFAVYTNYESDFTGDYTYFLGEEVTSFDDIGSDFEALVIPAATYAKFTSDPGSIPAIVINTWQKIWEMGSAESGAERAYRADFEVYDERSINPHNAIVDIYIGVKK